MAIYNLSDTDLTTRLTTGATATFDTAGVNAVINALNADSAFNPTAQVDVVAAPPVNGTAEAAIFTGSSPITFTPASTLSAVVVDTATGANLTVNNAGTLTILTGQGGDLVDINGAPSKDSVFTSAGNDTIYAGSGNDYVNAGAGNDVVYGQDGNDTIYAGTGADTIYAGTGNDSIYLNAGRGTDSVVGGTGVDRLYLLGHNRADAVITKAGAITTINFCQGEVVKVSGVEFLHFADKIVKI